MQVHCSHNILYLYFVANVHNILYLYLYLYFVVHVNNIILSRWRISSGSWPLQSLLRPRRKKYEEYIAKGTTRLGVECLELES